MGHCPNCNRETFFWAVENGDFIENVKQVFPRNIIRHTCPWCLSIVKEAKRIIYNYYKRTIRKSQVLNK